MLTTVGALAHVPSYAATPAGPEMVHNSGVACGLQCCCLGVARRGVTLGGGRAVAVDAGAGAGPGFQTWVFKILKSNFSTT